MRGDRWYQRVLNKDCMFNGSIHHNVDPTHLRALSDRLVIEVQDARSRCFSFGQNLLRLLQVLQKRKTMSVLKEKWHYDTLASQNNAHTCQ